MKQTGTTLLIFLMNFIAIFSLWEVPFVAACVFVVIGLLTLYVHRHPLIYLGVIAVGFLFEALAVHVGIWHYGVPQAWGFPLWVPLGWGNLILGLHMLWMRQRSS